MHFCFQSNNWNDDPKGGETTQLDEMPIVDEPNMRPSTPILMMKNVRGCFQQFLRRPSTRFEQTHMGSSDWKWPMCANGRPWSSHRRDCGRAAFLRPWAGWQSQVLGQGRGLMALDLGVAVNGSRLRFFQCFWYFGVERVRGRLSSMSFLSQWMFKPWQLKTRG